jgi:hypothetical protein
MDARGAMAFVKRHGIVLMAARGSVPSLAEAIGGGPFRGSWWSHPKAQQMFRIFNAVSDSSQILVCRLVGGKVTFVHRRLWPALARLSGRLPKRGLAAIREEHTESGRHRVRITPYPRWVPKEVLGKAGKMSLEDALARCGAGVVSKAGRRAAARRRVKA